MARARSQTKGNSEAFSQFIEHVLAAAVAARARDKRTAVIDACRDLLCGGPPFRLDLQHSEQHLYAQALLALVVNDLKKVKGKALLDELRSAYVSDDALKRVTGKEWTHSMLQNYLGLTEKKTLYRDAFNSLRSRFGSIEHLRVAIVPSSQLKYVKTIREAFVGSIRRVEPRWEPIDTVSGARTGLLDDPVWNDIERQLKPHLQRGTLDFVVTIGTQAAIKVSGMAALPPHIFLGVTRPIEAGLITSFKAPHARPTSGVAYCGELGMKDLVDTLARTFPDFPLVFIYKKDIPQDEHLAADIKRFKLAIKPFPTTEYPQLKDFVDPRAVYLSWYTFELMLEEAQSDVEEILRRRIVVSTTLANVRHHSVPVAIAPNDHEIGEEGAAMLLRAVESPHLLQAEKVAATPLHVELNSDAEVFTRLGLRITSDRRIERVGA